MIINNFHSFSRGAYNESSRGRKIQSFLFILGILLGFAFFLFTYLHFTVFYHERGPCISWQTTLFQFFWNLEFAVKNLSLIPYNYENSTNCLLCNYEPHNVLPNSTPRDVIVNLVFGNPVNILPFIRTLRTTKSKASCVFIIESGSYHNLNEQTKNFMSNCGIQAITFDWPATKIKVYRKCYLFHLIELFLRSNQMNINRVSIMDLFDTVFQGDPFNELLPKNAIHIVDEGATYEGNGYIANKNRQYLSAFDPDFNFTNEIIKTKFWCSGYMEGPIQHMITLLMVFSSALVPVDLAADQGGFNYINVSGKIQKALIPVAPPNDNIERVRHSSHFKLDESFPNVTAMYNKKLTATVIHHYYRSNDNFKISLLKACPRPDSNSNDYLSKCKNECISKLEEIIKNEYM